MRLSRTKLAAVVNQLLIATKNDKNVPAEIAAYLLTSNRVRELDSLLRDIRQIRADNGSVEVDVVTAKPLTTISRASIVQTVTATFPATTKVSLNERIDPSVVAGVRLELANVLFDATAKAKLNRFHQTIRSSN